jgi:hypothetical protein
VEPGDASREDALRREIHEELAAAVDIVKLIQIIDGDTDRQYIYLARIETWSFPDRNGPEFSEPGRGFYAIDTIPLTTASLGAVELKPDALAVFLTGALVEHHSLFALPDLHTRSGPSSAAGL